MPSRLSHAGPLISLIVLLSMLLAIAVQRFYFPDALQAQSGPAPALNTYDARCYRSISQSDDLLCLLAYQAPQQTSTIGTNVTTPEAWCAWLTNQTGCTGTNVSPSAPESLQPGLAVATLCQLTTQVGCLVDTGTLIDQTRLPRIWHGLAGMYFSALPGIAWGDASLNFCVESATGFSPTSSACVPADWTSAANTQAAQRTQMAADLKILLADIAERRGAGTNAYVASDRITSAGRTLALEAYAYMDRVIPSAFQAAAISAEVTPYSGTPAGAVALATQIAATQTARNFLNSQPGPDSVIGVTGGFRNTLLFMGFGILAAIAVLKFTQNIPLTVIAFGAVAMTGIFVGGPTISAVAVAVVLLALMAGWFILGRSPAG